MAIDPSRYVEKYISDYLERLNLNHCWVFNFNVINNVDAFLRSVIFSKYKTVGFVVHENRKEKAKELVEIAKKHKVTAVVYLSEMLDEKTSLYVLKVSSLKRSF